jgi:hypothetical protein
LAAVSAGCDAERTVQLDLGLDSSPLGLSCDPPDGDHLMVRGIVDDSSFRMAVVFDLIEVDTQDCRIEPLRKFCNDNDCTMMFDQRTCFDIGFDFDPDDPPAPIDAFATVKALIADALTDEVWQVDAPDQRVVVRMAAVRGTCRRRVATTRSTCG